MKSFFLVFNNDMPLAVAFSAEQAGREMTAQKLRLDKQGDDRHVLRIEEVRAASVPIVMLGKEEADCLDATLETEGMEVPRGMWKEFEALRGKGLVTLGAARGPGGDWRRAELTDLGEQVAIHNRGGAL